MVTLACPVDSVELQGSTCVIAVCWKDTSGVCEQRCVVMGAPEAWVCTGMAVRGQPRLSLQEIRETPLPSPVLPLCPWCFSLMTLKAVNMVS